jgi:hypothetical protein
MASVGIIRRILNRLDPLEADQGVVRDVSPPNFEEPIEAIATLNDILPFCVDSEGDPIVYWQPFTLKDDEGKVWYSVPGLAFIADNQANGLIQVPLSHITAFIADASMVGGVGTEAERPEELEPPLSEIINVSAAVTGQQSIGVEQGVPQVVTLEGRQSLQFESGYGITAIPVNHIPFVEYGLA